MAQLINKSDLNSVISKREAEFSNENSDLDNILFLVLFS